MLSRSLKRSCRLLFRNMCDSVANLFADNRVPVINPQSVVFVCKGNVCRSVVAEYLMKSVMSEANFKVGSCGLQVLEHTPSPEAAIRAARKVGVDMSGHLSKGVESCNLEDADLIFVMEFGQYRKLVRLHPNKKGAIRLLRKSAPFPGNLLCNIDDPYGQDDEMYEACFRQIRKTILAIKNSCERKDSYI